MSFSRSYLILRTKDKSIPDPPLATVLHVWLLMLSITVASLVTFALTAGLVGPYVFLAMFICFCISYAVETLTTKKMRSVVVHGVEDDPEEEEETASPTNEEESFTLISALSAIWIPCVVGDHPQGVYLASALSSLFSKVLVLAIAVALAASGEHRISPELYKLNK